MTVQNRGIRPQEFDHVMRILELNPADDAHKLLMALTQKKKRSITTILKMDKKQTTSLSSPDSDGNPMARDD